MLVRSIGSNPEMNRSGQSPAVLDGVHEGRRARAAGRVATRVNRSGQSPAVLDGVHEGRRARAAGRVATRVNSRSSPHSPSALFFRGLGNPLVAGSEFPLLTPTRRLRSVDSLVARRRCSTPRSRCERRVVLPVAVAGFWLVARRRCSTPHSRGENRAVLLATVRCFWLVAGGCASRPWIVSLDEAVRSGGLSPYSSPNFQSVSRYV